MIKDRVVQLIEAKGIAKEMFFSKIGMTSANFRGNAKKTPLNSTAIENIISEISDVNIEWLITGVGDMVLKREIAPIDDLSGVHYTYLLPLSAQGGIMDDFTTQVKLEECERIISPIKEVDFAIQVNGDSMAPEYPSGSRILIKKIDERVFIDWGKVYVLDTCNGTVIKKIMPATNNEKERVKCVSLNPEYPPFEVNLKDIYGMYRVLLCMAVK